MIEQVGKSLNSIQATPIEPLSELTKEHWIQKKMDLLRKDALEDHAINQEPLKYKEIVVEKKLAALRKQMLEEDPVLITSNYFSRKDKIKNSALYDCLKMMPKPAVHHTHLTATADVKYLVSLTYNDFVFYSEKENNFIVNKNGCSQDGYIKVNTLRQYACDA